MLSWSTRRQFLKAREVGLSGQGHKSAKSGSPPAHSAFRPTPEPVSPIPPVSSAVSSAGPETPFLSAAANLVEGYVDTTTPWARPIYDWFTRDNKARRSDAPTFQGLGGQRDKSGWYAGFEKDEDGICGLSAGYGDFLGMSVGKWMDPNTHETTRGFDIHAGFPTKNHTESKYKTKIEQGGPHFRTAMTVNDHTAEVDGHANLFSWGGGAESEKGSNGVALRGSVGVGGAARLHFGDSDGDGDRELGAGIDTMFGLGAGIDVISEGFNGISPQKYDHPVTPYCFKFEDGKPSKQNIDENLKRQCTDYRGPYQSWDAEVSAYRENMQRYNAQEAAKTK